MLALQQMHLWQLREKCNRRATAHLHAALLLATIALVAPSGHGQCAPAALTQTLSLAGFLPVVGYRLGLLFSLATLREISAGVAHAEAANQLAIGLALSH
jgi:hypothetical protein